MTCMFRPDWYEKVCPFQIATELARIRDTFQMERM